MNQTIKPYVYIDKNGIESLYNQLPNAIRTTKIKTSSNLAGTIQSEVNAGLSKIISGNLKSEIDSNSSISEEYVNEVSIEDKIDSLILFQAPDGNLQTLFEAAKRTTEGSNSLVVCRSCFTFLKAYDEKNEKTISQSDISEDPLKYKELSFVFKSSDRFANHDEINVEMFLSSSNLVRSVRHLNYAIQYDKDFLFKVFGELSYRKNGNYYLKPFAIWDMFGI